MAAGDIVRICRNRLKIDAVDELVILRSNLNRLSEQW